jgi:hypothetical protein
MSEAGATAETYVFLVAVAQMLPSWRLRRVERRLRRCARRGELPMSGVTMWAATRAVLRERGKHVAEMW